MKNLLMILRYVIVGSIMGLSDISISDIRYWLVLIALLLFDIEISKKSIGRIN